MASKNETVRLTIDVPVAQHTYIKMLATKEGVTLRQFVIEHLPTLQTKKGKKKGKDLPKDEFDELLENLLDEKAPVLKRLSKK
ncbi:MAG TPA: hypothetical protein VFU89_07755 [Rhabdochlamydiaceae bacterium]|nr:hypothetical protein [Rhabdochlamydiaceae bacterium]